jgi:4-alpha-glucanotransferase
MLISPEGLVHSGWLPRSSVESSPRFPEERVDFGRVAEWKTKLFREAWRHFEANAPREDRREMEAFVEHDDQAYWLEDWVLYAAIKSRFGGWSWTRWDRELRVRDAAALRSVARELADEISYQRFLQFAFAHQLELLRSEARARNVDLFGDLPFYTAHDSADVWSHPELFELNGDGLPARVAGVPPDYFSDTGQLWGNPVYRWQQMESDGYGWWIERIQSNLRRVAVLRLDHFRGFAAYWEVEATAKTAAEGRWVPGPGRELFDVLRRTLGDLPLVAEDLGLITEDVEELRDDLDLPGMHVLQFAFGEAESEHLPERHAARSVVYTGTHDNDTLVGWLQSLGEAERKRALTYLKAEDEAEVPWKMIEAAYRSPARFALVPLQDLLGLGPDARMNRPGTTRGNWSWRATTPSLTLELAARLRALAEATGR